MNIHRYTTCAVVLLASLGAPLKGQGGVAPVRGVVYDSLRGRPLRDALVTVVGDTRAIATDAQGRFRFDDIQAGKRTFVAQHPLLDSIGLSGLTAQATVAGERSEVRLAVPSFATLWGIACSGRPPKDSGVVFGTVRDAERGAPVANAKVEVSWSDFLLDRRRQVTQRRWQISTETNARGEYAACGVPEDLLQVQATLGSSETGEIELPPTNARIQRRDLLIGETNRNDSTKLGAIRGIVTTAAGMAWSGARVIAPGLEEVRTDAEGRFLLTGVTPGTRQIEVLAIGASPKYATTDVMPRATTELSIHVEPVPMLKGVRTTAEAGARVAAMEFTERRKSGVGYVRDSLDIAKQSQFMNVFRDIPSVNMQYKAGSLFITVPDGKGGACTPDVFIDGAAGGLGHLIDLSPTEVAGVEVYPRFTQVPLRFQRAGIRAQCGMILVWTKYGFRNR